MSEKKDSWFTYVVVTVVGVIMTYFAYTDYERFIDPGSLSSGKAVKHSC
jgi:hypothetical protein